MLNLGNDTSVDHLYSSDDFASVYEYINDLRVNEGPGT